MKPGWRCQTLPRECHHYCPLSHSDITHTHPCTPGVGVLSPSRHAGTRSARQTDGAWTCPPSAKRTRSITSSQLAGFQLKTNSSQRCHWLQRDLRIEGRQVVRTDRKRPPMLSDTAHGRGIIRNKYNGNIKVLRHFDKISYFIEITLEI